MGNAASNANGPRPSTISPRPRQASTSPSPGHPHSSLRTKKKSLELPDLASLTLSSTRGRQHSIPAKSASIPIPAHPYAVSTLPGDAGRTRAPITLPSNADVQLLATHEPSTHQPFPPPSRNSRSAQRRHQHQQRIQELYNQSQTPTNHAQPATRPQPAFVPETVNSTIPIGLTKALVDETPPEGPPELSPVKVTWRGGGKSVFLARAGDDDWKGRLAMTPESPGSSVYHATVYLPPGTHHIRFLIDDLWRVADDLPTAVDDQGSLANYVAVPITYSPPAQTSIPASPPPPYKLQPGQSFWSAASSTDDESADGNVPTSSSQAQTTAPAHTAHQHGTHHHPHNAAIWTDVIPPALIEAAREEEAYLAASEGSQSHHPGTHRVQGFVPAPNIPPAPGLPRHLDKLILNARPVAGTPNAVGAGSSSSNAGGRRSARDPGGGGSEAGTVDLDPSASASTPAPEVEITPPPSEQPSVPTSPTISSPASPTDGTTPALSPLVPAFVANSNSTSSSTATTATTTPTPSSPPTTPSSAPTSTPPSSTLPSARPLTLGLEADTRALTDDASVLPVPSHVVLHHLSTSAIRNGVLAVGNTTRYRKKYLTTIYYKPT
ncbi:putative 5'-AMP-activated protein kinase beta subunit, interation domain [Lyophyllum shimeji]|uniref:5'-AMP-activated protein kinase beta subunit, interation domain n=1 Tax=Lyophyllum shimeji TaxID=47721 RepID=A0A9P3PNE9_LYOSH|nr:putative 5'-AMP-activated protein kinase beta subunit, interation domain [Lyophyllum shimeji]